MDHLIGAIIGLITFFLFPIGEYFLKRKFSEKDGNPELWYLPKFGFRLVIRNLPRKVKLYDLKYESKIRRIIPASEGSSVSTLDEEVLTKSESFFLLPGYDQIILAFRLQKENSKSYLIHSNKIGEELKRFDLDKVDTLISDYTANIDNKYHFDLRIGRRVEIKKQSLIRFLEIIEQNNFEQPFLIDKMIKIG